MKKEINAAGAPGAIGPYSQAIEAGGFLYVSGQLPINAADGTMPADIKGQTTQSLENVKAILAEAGATTDNVVKTTVFLADMSLFGPMNEVYATYFSKPFPARCAFDVKEGHSKTLKSRGYFKINGLKLILRTTKVMGRTPAP